MAIMIVNLPADMVEGAVDRLGDDITDVTVLEVVARYCPTCGQKVDEHGNCQTPGCNLPLKD